MNIDVCTHARSKVRKKNLVAQFDMVLMSYKVSFTRTCEWFLHRNSCVVNIMCIVKKEV